MSYPAYLRGVPPTPASAPRTPMPSATSGAAAYGPGLEHAEIGCAATFTVEALDPYGEQRRQGGDERALCVAMVSCQHVASALHRGFLTLRPFRVQKLNSSTFHSTSNDETLI